MYKRQNYNWSQSQKDALTSFLYNLGPRALNQVTAQGTRTNEEIADKMLEYNTSKGEVMAGLTQRRREESDQFRSGLNYGD